MGRQWLHAKRLVAGSRTTPFFENFAEAIRLFTTTKEFLEKSGYSEMAGFIKKYFPEIQ